MTTKELLERITGSDEKARGEAWQSAGPVGVTAIKPLAEVMLAAEMETARAAKRALWNIVRHAGRPGADAERAAVAAELAGLLGQGKADVRREFVWMLSEIGGDAEVERVAGLLKERALREDARAALERIPGNRSLRALEEALQSGPEDHRPAIAVSLRVRGRKVQGYPSEKLVPTKKTDVKIAAIKG